MFDTEGIVLRGDFTTCGESNRIGETLTATREDRYRILRSFFSTPGMGVSAFHCANHRVSCKCQQTPGWKIRRFFRWKMPFAVFRSGSGVSDRNSGRILLAPFGELGAGRPSCRRPSSTR